MEYTPSNPEDVRLHKKFHTQNVGGVDLKKTFCDSARAENCVWKGEDGDCVVEIRANDAPVKRRAVEDVLEVVAKELGSVSIPLEELWGEMRIPKPDTERRNMNHDRHKAFLYIRGMKCAGMCLAQRISTAFAVISPNSSAANSTDLNRDSSSSVSRSSEQRKAVLGVSRIWTSNSARRAGIASTLLETARQNFLFGIEVPKEQMAFSQPTESGGKLARRWFGQESGWLVYTE
jgi:N-acetyltransferase